MSKTDWNNLPTFDELPKFHEFTGCAWSIWGEKDELGTVNLLTADVVKQAAQEIRTGRSVSLNWPINFPETPLFTRKQPAHSIVTRHGNPHIPGRDDELYINTQSGSQWDGLRHFGVLRHSVFYNNTPASDIAIGPIEIYSPSQSRQASIKLDWAQHGISGRGVLLDLVRFYTGSGSPLPYDPWTSHGFTVKELEACAAHQGVEFKQGDILIIRAGFTQKYNASTDEARNELASKPEAFAGVEQSEDMKRFLWNNHFAAIASDQPAIERWPPVDDAYLHQTLLGMWGMPIGELFDLEALSAVCAETNRFTFFFTSWPLNLLGGCASPPNAAAYL